MIAGLFTTLVGSVWACTAFRYGVIVLARSLFLLSTRYCRECVCRIAERLETILNQGEGE